MKRLAVILSVAALAASSCDKIAFRSDTFDHTVRVSPVVSAMTRGYHESAGTIQDFDLWINNHTNSKYSYTNTRFVRNETEWTPERMMLWESAASAMDYLAVSPSVARRDISLGSVAEGGTVFEFEVESMQTKDSPASDLLTAVGCNTSLSGDSDKNIPKIPTDDDGRILVNFSHALCLLQVELTFRTEFNHDGIPETCPVSGLTVGGTVREGKYVTEFSEGRLSSFRAMAKDGASVSDIGAYETSWTKASDKMGNCKAVFECIFVPQRASLKIGFVLGGRSYTFTARETDCMAGNKYVLPLTVGKDEIIMSKDEITALPWVAGNGEGEGIETD